MYEAFMEAPYDYTWNSNIDQRELTRAGSGFDKVIWWVKES